MYPNGVRGEAPKAFDIGVLSHAKIAANGTVFLQ